MLLKSRKNALFVNLAWLFMIGWVLRPMVPCGNTHFCSSIPYTLIVPWKLIRVLDEFLANLFKLLENPFPHRTIRSPSASLSFVQSKMGLIWSRKSSSVGDVV